MNPDLDMEIFRQLWTELKRAELAYNRAEHQLQCFLAAKELEKLNFEIPPGTFLPNEVWDYVTYRHYQIT